MKASKMIESLAHVISTYGDIEVCVEDAAGKNVNIDIADGERYDDDLVVLLNAYYNPNEDV